MVMCDGVELGDMSGSNRLPVERRLTCSSLTLSGLAAFFGFGGSHAK